LAQPWLLQISTQSVVAIMHVQQQGVTKIRTTLGCVALVGPYSILFGVSKGSANVDLVEAIDNVNGEGVKHR
jgi:hypothetical protein